MTRLLVISPDKTGPLMAGTAIRSLEIARALAASCEVTLAVPPGSTRVAGALRQVTVPGESTLPPLVDAADVVLISGRTELMTAVRKPLIVDLYDPFILSDLEFYGDRFAATGGRPLLALRWLQHHLAHGDLFLCASEAQRSFWLGMLAAAGRVNRANYAGDPTLAGLLALVPFGIPHEPPVATGPAVKGVLPGIAPSDRVVLWAGGLWNWFDPLTLIRAMAALGATHPDVKALFLGVRHPNPDIGTMAMAEHARTLADELGLHDRTCFFADWVPYGERQNYLLEADVGVSLHQPGIEAQFAFRTRVLDYLWCGVPMVLSRGDELAARVERERLGIAVPEGDAAAVAAALARLLAEDGGTERGARFARVRAELAWSRVVAPVEDFCRGPRLAPDKTAGAWVAPDTARRDLIRKEDALVSEEELGERRALSPPLGRHFAVEHVFVAAYDALCRIDVLVWRLAPSPPADLVFTLSADEPHGRRLVRVATPLATLPADDWQRFEFRPLPNSRGRRYRIRLEAPATEDAGIALWLRPDAGDTAPAMARHYLVKGVVDALPVDPESFLFLHNTTVGEDLVPGLATLAAAGDDVASSLVGDDAAAHGERAIDAELARLAAEVAVTRRRLAEVETAQAAAAERPLVPRLARELARVATRLLQRALRLGGGVLVLLLVVLSIPLALAVAAALAATDVVTWALRRRLRVPAPLAATCPPPGTYRDAPVSVVIPTWNGRDLLAMSLPPLEAALAAHPPGGELVVVDNGSSDDTRAFLAAEHPAVRVIALPRNAGFAGAANRGVRESHHPTVILLNNDMVVEPDFVAPLLAALEAEPEVFGVSCQIDFIDKTKPRWETGKVHARWKHGAISLFHLDRWEPDRLYPVFFAGGGASAYDRARFLALGGFDEAVFAPVYIEDVDLGYRAWVRGWPSLFQPASLVHHKHRGTTRRLWSEHQIYSFFVKNLAALAWKNVRDWRILAAHLAGLVILPLRVFSQAGARAALHTWPGLARQLLPVMRARLREAAAPRRLDDAEIFQVSRWRHAYRARFGRRRAADPTRPRVLIVSPYSPYPPLHGGAVRMLALLERLERGADVTLLSYGDTPAELDPRSVAELRRRCHEALVLERDTTAAGGILAPAKTRGFWSAAMVEQLEYYLDRDDLDVLQIEYTHLAHLLPPPVAGLVRVLVEHDVSFVSHARARAALPGRAARLAAWFDWLRMLRYELAAVESADLVLTMSTTDRAALGRFVDVDHVVPIPNGVDCRAFPFASADGDVDTILFVGFFRHEPNVEAVRFFARAVLPRIRAAVPGARFRVVGAYPPEGLRRLADDPTIEVTGRVADVGPYYRQSAVFVAPVLQGSGTRLKILEAMASGCPVVATTIGAEGIEARDGEHLRLADGPAALADAVIALLADRAGARALAARARALVEARYDWDAIAERLLAAYRAALRGEPPDPA